MNKPDLKIQQVLTLMQDDIDYQRYFFTNSSSLKMFFPLKTAGYFDPSRIKVENGYAEYWFPIGYLERISKSPKIETDLAKNILEIIDQTVDFSRTKQKLNNLYNWWGFLKIILSLPTGVIRDSVTPDKFKSWLDEFIEPTGKHNPITHDISNELLIKFLQDDSVKDYSLKIFESMIEIKKNPQEEKYFRRNEVLLVFDESWLWQSFFQNENLIIEKLFSKGVLLLANKLKTALEYEHKFSWINIDIAESHYRIYVYRVPEEGVIDGKIAFEKNLYKCKFKKYSDEQVGNQDDFFKQARFDIEPSIELEGSFTFTANNEEELIATIKQNLPNNVSWELDGDFEEKLTHLYGNFFRDYSTVWFKSIEHGVRHLYHADEILGMALRSFLIKGYEKNRGLAKELVSKFISSDFKFTIFKRLALFLINEHWADLSSFFIQFINSSSNLLAEHEYELELHDILKSKISEFPKELVEKIRQLILDVPSYYKEKGERYENYWKYKWYSALADNDDFKQDFVNAKIGAEISEDKPFAPERTEDEGRFLVNISPLSKEELLKLNILDIVKFLKEFKTADEMAVWNGKPDRKGLANSLTEAVKEDPAKFDKQIDEFIEVSPLYIRSIFSGFRSALNSEKTVHWNGLLEFILKYSEILGKGSEELQRELDEDQISPIYFFNEAFDLIEIGCKKNLDAFDENSFVLIEKVFDAICPFLKSEPIPEEKGDVLNFVFRSSLGRTIRNYLELTFLFSKKMKSKEPDWGARKFERFIKIGYEPNIWLGVYLVHLRDLDKKYIDNKILEYSQMDTNKNEWQMFVQGYLEGSFITPDVYQLMRPLYEKLFDIESFNQRVEEQIVSHFCIGYIQGFESLEVENENGNFSLFRRLFEDANTSIKQSRWIQVPLDFSEYLGRKEALEVAPKVLQFWRWSFTNQEIVKNKLKDSYNLYLEKLIHLLGFIEKINKEAEDWILLSIPFAHLDHRVSFVIDNLEKFEDEESIKRIGKIFKELLRYSTPAYYDENVKNIVKRLFDLGLKPNHAETFQDAKDICNTFGRRGLNFLKPLYEEFEAKLSQ